MNPLDSQIIFVLLALATGSGVFLRLVAKEKHRREKWLKFRFEEKLKRLQEEQLSSGQEDEARTTVAR